MKNLPKDYKYNSSFISNYKKREQKFDELKSKAKIFKQKNPDYKKVWDNQIAELHDHEYKIKNYNLEKLLYLLINNEYKVIEVRKMLQEIFKLHPDVIDLSQFRQLVCYLDKFCT